MHTSTVTVVVLEPVPANQWQLLDRDIDVMTTRDTGPGGQHRNTTDSCVVMVHRPTGVRVKSAAKSQHRNRKAARELLEARVAQLYASQGQARLARQRRELAGSGMRADKVRTYREMDNRITDHRTGRKVSLKPVLAGKLELLF